MRRRKFLKNLAAGAVLPSVVAGTACPQLTRSQEKIEWQLISKFRVRKTLEDFIRIVAEASKGQLNIILSSEASRPELKIPEDVSSGKIEMGYGYGINSPPEKEGAAAAKKIPALDFLIMPFGLTTQEYNAWIEHGGGQEILDKIYGQIGCKYFPAGNTGIQMGGWFNKEINSIEDLKGLKIRISGFGAAAMKALGAEPYDFAPWSEVANRALKEGRLDAFERGSPVSDLSVGLHKQFKYYYYPAWHEPAVPRNLLINLSKWDDLPLNLKTIISTAARWLTLQWMNERMAENVGALETLIKEDSVQLRQFPEPVLKELAKVSHQIMHEHASQDKVSLEIFNSIMQFKAKASSWAMVSLQPYLEARGRL
jgi:TRAP-type mannitol/chloroaromatic compound transport system substrate-binding protein